LRKKNLKAYKYTKYLQGEDSKIYPELIKNSELSNAVFGVYSINNSELGSSSDQVEEGQVYTNFEKLNNNYIDISPTKKKEINILKKISHSKILNQWV
jgi:hypothetical protein